MIMNLHPVTVYEQLQTCYDSVLMAIHNAYAEDNNSPDDKIFANTPDDLNEVFGDDRASVVCSAVCGNHFNPSHPWVTFDEDREELYSTEFPAEYLDPRDVKALADYARDHPDLADHCGLDEDSEASYEEQIEAMEHDFNEQNHLVELMNSWNESLGNSNAIIYSNEEATVNDLLFTDEAWNIACRTAFGEYDFGDNFFRFNGKGNLESTHYLEDFVDLQDLAYFVIDNPGIAREYDIDVSYLDTYVEDQAKLLTDEDKAQLIGCYNAEAPADERIASAEAASDDDWERLGDWLKDHEDIAMKFDIETDRYALTMTPPLKLAENRLGHAVSVSVPEEKQAVEEKVEATQSRGR